MDRRTFVKIAAIAAASPVALLSRDENSLKHIVSGAEYDKLREKPIGELVGYIGKKLLGMPYKAWLLEGEPEKCRVSLDNFDCVTFFETSLCLARIIIRDGAPTHEKLVDEATFTRYRSGNLTDYTSRLHYTADWIWDNVQKGVVKDVTESSGGEKFDVNVDFMSTHPQFYAALKAHPEYVPIIENIEKQINSREHYYIPKKKVADSEKNLQTGDIIAISTSTKGLDYSHTGLIFVDDAGERRFLHASSKAKKVVLGPRISDYIAPIKNDTGISVARPLEPS